MNSVELPHVDVVILTWNDGPLLEVAVASAIASDGVEVKVVVVDNGSSPPATAVADPRLSLLRNEVNRGVAAARNQGVRTGSASFVCLLDSDAKLHPGSLRKLLLPLLEDDDVGLAVPVFSDQTPGASAGRVPTVATKVSRVLGMRSTYDSPSAEGDSSVASWEVDFGIGACQVFRRDAFNAVGGIDESFFYGPEDVDFCLRVRRAGWRVHQVRNAPVDHPPRRRHRGLMTRRGMAHAWAVVRFLWRYRSGAGDVVPR